jgi:hypothetical protein
MSAGSERTVDHVIGWLKLIGSLLLVACFALPMKSCTGYEGPEGEPVVVGVDGVPPPGVRYVTERYYLWEELNAADPKSWLRVAVFLGPAASVMFARRRPKSRVRKALWLMEPVLLAGVVYSLWHMIFPFYTAEIGWYAACAGVAICFAGWLGETYQRWWQWRRGRLTES